nr:hypothetical protein [Angustibacter aerolatus]
MVPCGRTTRPRGARRDDGRGLKPAGWHADAAGRGARDPAGDAPDHRDERSAGAARALPRLRPDAARRHHLVPHLLHRPDARATAGRCAAARRRRALGRCGRPPARDGRRRRRGPRGGSRPHARRARRERAQHRGLWSRVPGTRGARAAVGAAGFVAVCGIALVAMLLLGHLV